MVEGRGCAGFALKPLQCLRRRGERLRQDLDGDRPMEPRIRGPIYFAHPAGAKRRLNPIWAKVGSRAQRHAASSLIK